MVNQSCDKLDIFISLKNVHFNSLNLSLYFREIITCKYGNKVFGVCRCVCVLVIVNVTRDSGCGYFLPVWLCPIRFISPNAACHNLPDVTMDNTSMELSCTMWVAHAWMYLSERTSLFSRCFEKKNYVYNDLFMRNNPCLPVDVIHKLVSVWHYMRTRDNNLLHLY